MSSNINLSHSEQMYLVMVRQICEHCENTPVPIPDIAAGLDVQPVSANQMIKKLAETGWVVYTPYKGVELTEEGFVISTRILRRRRLWEVFLVKYLEMELEEADALACQLEHIATDDVVDRLSDFLDHPAVCFHGDPIYSGEDGNNCSITPPVPLSSIKVGQPFQVVRIDEDVNLQSFLADAGIFPGQRGLIIAVNSTRNILLETNLGQRVTITREIADYILVKES